MITMLMEELKIQNEKKKQEGFTFTKASMSALLFIIQIISFPLTPHKNSESHSFSISQIPRMSTFPTDLIHDILCRLPVKTLVRFKCVSKPWLSLIDASDFVKSHLHNSLKTNTNVKLVLDHYLEGDDKVYIVDPDSLGNMMQIRRPFKAERNDHRSRIFGSCNGLLAVYHREAGIALWNPSTRNCRYLPAAPTVKSSSRNYSTLGFLYRSHDDPILGFGYDVIANDYKVVKMIGCQIVMVYSLKANCWKWIKDCPYGFPFGTNDGAYVNGSLHWVGCQKGSFPGGELIFALDLGVEEYHEVLECDVSFSNLNAGVLGGCLCVFRDGYNDKDCISLWVMKEYGVRESWTKLFCLPTKSMTSIHWTKAIGYAENGNRILLDVGGNFELFWYNLEKKRRESCRIQDAPVVFSAITYVESLLPINSTEQRRIQGEAERGSGPRMPLKFFLMHDA